MVDCRCGTLRSAIGGLSVLDRRQIITRVAILPIAAIQVATARAQQPSGTAPTGASMLGGKMTLHECAESCHLSHVMCLETATYCIGKGGMHAASAHLALLLDCAEMCQTTENSLLRRSSQHAALCNACAQICDACAESCEAMGADETMQRCAKTCRNCAESCNDMSKQAI
jgi:hypothetical protein